MESKAAPGAETRRASLASSAPSSAAPPPPVEPPPSPPAATPSASDQAERLELTRYRAAHALHFNARDYGAALPAWDAYLAAFPSGALAHEARYNRAICLLELGRGREAAVALGPFSDGKVAGGYRRREARALLEAMDGGAPRP